MFKNPSISFSDSFPADFSFKRADMSLCEVQQHLEGVWRMLNKLQQQQIISVHKVTSTAGAAEKANEDKCSDESTPKGTPNACYDVVYRLT